jgi:ribosome maturation factor RimP
LAVDQQTVEHMSDAVIERVREFADSLLPAMGLELFDVQFRREGHGWVLRLVVDREEGVKLDDCSRVSRETSDFLDVEDIIEHPYHLEVSSPGLERPLRTVEECRRHLGKKARFKVKEEVDSRRVIIGELQSIDKDEISVLSEEGETFKLNWENVQKARLTL